MNDPTAAAEDAEPRFLLSGSEPLQADAVAAVLTVLQPAALVVRGGSGQGWLKLAGEHGAALLIEDDLEGALGADGIHLTDSDRVAEVRSAFDRKAEDRLILGADVGLSRHDAMVASEAGADYVAFGRRGTSADDVVIELVAWWRQVTVMPCLGYAEDADAVGRLARLGTEFIGVGEAIWRHPQGPSAAAATFCAALEKS